MGRLFEEATKQRALFKAWQKIKANGRRSIADETRDAIEDFDRDSLGKIRQIQKQLRSGDFVFDPQHGVTKRKSSGGKRGIVMASVRNRIVERAILDTLQSRSDFVRSVNTQKTSVGGVPTEVSRTDYSKLQRLTTKAKFTSFGQISRVFSMAFHATEVLAALAKDIPDQEFLELLNKASTVTLGNAESLGEDRKFFQPTMKVLRRDRHFHRSSETFFCLILTTVKWPGSCMHQVRRRLCRHVEFRS